MFPRAGALAALALALAPGACTYAWPVGAAEDAGDARAPSDAEADGAPPADAARDADAAPDAPAPDAPADVTVDCAALRANLESAKDAAKKCFASPPECADSVLDECGCKTWVDHASSQATSAYASAVAAFVASGCPRGCTACAFEDAGTGLCLAAQGGGIACQP